MEIVPSFSFERKLWNLPAQTGKGFKRVAGVDEVGRGCFAGPVVAACVAFAPFSNFHFPISNESSKEIVINDSKKLTARQRERAGEWIKKNVLGWGIGEAPATLINRIGMARATKIAFRRAISDARQRLKQPIDFLLIDAFFIPYVPGLPTRRRKDRKGRYRKKANGRQLAIINGDEKSVSIAAASIIAKVYRDKLMISLSKQSKYKKYKWGKNKGYGTREHQEAIKKYGLTRYHRKQFIETFIKNSKTQELL